MRHLFVTALAAILLFSSTSAGQTKLRPLVVVADVDYERYSGTWFEIARLPTYAQKLCASDSISSYAVRLDGLLEVRNSCRKENGDFLEASGVARHVAGHPRSSLQVRYGPGFLSFLPGSWTDYQIIDLGEQYEYAVVGTPDRSSLRILSRTPRMAPDLYRTLVERAQAQAFDVDELVTIDHTLTR